MRRLLTIACCVAMALQSKAQEFPSDLGTNPKYDEHRDIPTVVQDMSDPSYKYAVGIQFSYPVYTLSFKYAVTDASVLQAMVSPFAAGYGNYDYSYYGVRYIYRFPFYSLPLYGPTTISYPYFFGGAGVLSFHYPVFNNAGDFDHKATNSQVGYSIGLGYEWIFGRHLGLAVEAGYGAVQANGSGLEDAFTYSGALHYYFHGHARKVRVQEDEATDNPDEQDQQAAPDEQPDQDQPAPRSRKHRVVREDNEE